MYICKIYTDKKKRKNTIFFYDDWITPAKLLQTVITSLIASMLLSKLFSWFHECGDGEVSSGHNIFLSFIIL